MIPQLEIWRRWLTSITTFLLKTRCSYIATTFWITIMIASLISWKERTELSVFLIKQRVLLPLFDINMSPFPASPHWITPSGISRKVSLVKFAKITIVNLWTLTISYSTITKASWKTIWPCKTYPMMFLKPFLIWFWLRKHQIRILYEFPKWNDTIVQLQNRDEPMNANENFYILQNHLVVHRPFSLVVHFLAIFWLSFWNLLSFLLFSFYSS